MTTLKNKKILITYMDQSRIIRCYTLACNCTLKEDIDLILMCTISYSLARDLNTPKSAGTSCEIEIVFSTQTIKFLMKYNLICFQISGRLRVFKPPLPPLSVGSVMINCQKLNVWLFFTTLNGGKEVMKFVSRRGIVLGILGATVPRIEFFNNSDAILNFEHVAMHCGLSRVIQLF